jgi:uncharacterized protein (TIGR00290 family)
MSTTPVLLSWSSGKDSAWSLFKLRERPELEVVGLLTTLNEQFDRVSMHAVRRELLMEQASAAGLELWVVAIPYPCTNDEYEEAMSGTLKKAKSSGIEGVAFGDLFLEDVRRYREERMAAMDFSPFFPLWGLSTPELAKEMISGGLRAKVTCLDPNVLDRRFVGRDWDHSFIEALPAEVDPCGENGEFHTFAYDGPTFSGGIAVDVGQVELRDGFVFADPVKASKALSAAS